MKNIKIIFTAFLSLLVLYSCFGHGSTTGGNNTISGRPDIDESLSLTTNDTCKEPNKSFSTQSEKEKIPNEGFRVKILKKSFNSPVKISNKYKYPLVNPISYKGIEIKPTIIKTIKHYPLSKSEIKRKRKELSEMLLKALKDQYKKERKSLYNKRKEELILNREKIKEILKNYKKGSPERRTLISEQIELREEIINEFRDDREDLKKAYKEDVKELKALFNDSINYKDDKNKDKKSFSVKAINDCADIIYCNSLVNFYSEEEYYEYFDSNESYQINDRYVDGEIYTDQNQKETAELNDYLKGYELSEKDVLKFSSNGINLNGCSTLKTDVYKSGNKVNLIVNKDSIGEDCNISEFNLEYKVSDCNCGQENKINIGIENTNGSFAMSSYIPFEQLGKGRKEEIFLTVKSIDGKTQTIKLGEIDTTKEFEEPLKSEDVQITKKYSMKYIEDTLFTIKNLDVNQDSTTIDKLSNDSNKIEFAIKKINLSKYSGYTVKVVDMLGQETFSETCPAGKTEFTFSRKKEDMDVGEYTLQVINSENTIIAQEKFISSKVMAYPFSTNTIFPNSSEYSEENEKVVVIKDALEIQKIPYSTPFSKPESCDMNKSFNNLVELNAQALYYPKYILSLLDKNQNLNNNLSKSDLSSCSKDPIVVGAWVDLKSSNIEVNKEMLKRNIFVNLSLALEDESCNEITNWHFPVKLGSTHFITKQFYSSLLGNFCKNKVFYVKVKKISPTKVLFPNYSFEQKVFNGTSNNPQNSPPIDIMPVVINPVSNIQNDIKYQGTRTILSKCESEPCHENFLESYEKVQTVSKKDVELTTEFTSPTFYAGDKIDLFIDNRFNYEKHVVITKDNKTYRILKSPPPEKNYLLDIIKNKSDLTLEGNTIIVDEKLAQDLKRAEEQIVSEIDSQILPEFNKQRQIFLDSFRDISVYSGFLIGGRDNITKFTSFKSNLKEMEKTSLETLEKINNKGVFIQANNERKYVQGMQFKSVWARAFQVVNFTNTIVDESIRLYNETSNAKLRYTEALRDVSLILEKIRSKECLENLDTNQMSRIQRYLNNIVIIPLYQMNFNLDQESIGSSDYNKLASDLATASIEAKSNLSVVSNSLRSDCEFKCDVSDFERKTGTVKTHIIKCRLNYKSLEDYTKKKKRDNRVDLANALNETNNAKNLLIGKVDYTENRTLAYSVINNETLYTINRNEDDNLPSNFAKIMPDVKNRFFSATLPNGQVKGGFGFNSTHAEVRLLEQIARNRCDSDNKGIPIPKKVNDDDDDTFTIYTKTKVLTFKKFTCRPTTIVLFSDRATCNNCLKLMCDTCEESIIDGDDNSDKEESLDDSTVKTISSVVKQATGFDLIVKNLEFKTTSPSNATRNGLFYEKELIPRWRDSFYSSLLE